MIKLSKEQRTRLTGKRDSNIKTLDRLLSNLGEDRARGLGQTTNRLSWDVSAMMEADQRAQAYDGLLFTCDDEKSTKTLESIRDAYLQCILAWDPSPSTSPSHNMEEDIRDGVNKDMYETLQTLLENQ